MNGIVGYKPTARRVPITGVVPLSTSLDSIGPLANTVACCAAIDAVFAGETPPDLVPGSVAGLRLAAPQNAVLDGMDAEVANAYEAALAKLSAAGARIDRITLAAFDEIPRANARGTFAAAEAWAWHADLIAAKAEGYDPQVLKRIMPGRDMGAGAYVDLLRARAEICARASAATQDFDAVVMPTCPLLPPPIAALEADSDAYTRVNLMQLRNCAFGNFLDRCAISLPCTPKGAAPVGLMLMGETMGDARLFRVAAAVESALA
jgi:aspartyl-tRNA(Asn)/glutamyl-tRNA(Gln) amidotransferase subunit A